MSHLIQWNSVWPSFIDDNNGVALLPAVDMYETTDSVIVEVPLPNIEVDNIDVEVHGQTLTLSGKTEHANEIDEKHYYRKEIRRGSFSRTVALPCSVKSDEALANYEKGVLKITLPKLAADNGQKIKINKVGE